MSKLRKSTKSEKLVDLFSEVGMKISIKEVCDKTGIPNRNTLKSFCSYIRRAKHIPEESRVDIRLIDDDCVRVK